MCILCFLVTLKVKHNVKCNGCFSNWFPVRSGVRQGSVLSPKLFTVFMNIFILNIRNQDLGCYVNFSLVSCILYADDVILLSASLAVLQDMLHIVHLTASDLLLEFNFDNSYGIAFAPNASNLPSLFARGKTLNWCSTVKYLGVYLVSGKHLRIDFDAVKRKFYSPCNCILSNSHCTNELIQLHLQESYCLPILTYAFPGLRANASQIKDLMSVGTVCTRKYFITTDGSQLNVV